MGDGIDSTGGLMSSEGQAASDGVFGRSSPKSTADFVAGGYVSDLSWLNERITIRRTLRLLRSDYQRMADHYQFPLTPLRALQMTILPAIIALILFRFSHYFFVINFRVGAWFLYTLNIAITGMDVVPGTKLGERCLLGHTTSTILSGQIGRNATLYARVGTGGGRDALDIGAGPGMPVIGDNVTIGANASVMGSIFIGDGTFVGAHSLVLNDAPPNSVLMGVPAVVRRQRTSAEATEENASVLQPAVDET